MFAILNRISPCNAVLAGVYSTYSKWINKEIAICKNEILNPKPIVAIEPRGSEKNVSSCQGQRGQDSQVEYGQHCARQ